MTETWLHDVEAWREFYLLVGTAGATLIGLMFVVVSLAPHIVAAHKTTGVRAFNTPIVVDFAAALVVSSFMMTPLLTPVMIAIVLAAIGTAGICYQVFNGSHREWQVNKLAFVDWIWFVALPILSHAILLAAALALATQTPFALYAVGAAALLLIVIGIRNAWDIVLWMAEQPRG